METPIKHGMIWMFFVWEIPGNSFTKNSRVCWGMLPGEVPTVGLQEDLRAILFEPKVGVQCLAFDATASILADFLGKNASSLGMLG